MEEKKLVVLGVCGSIAAYKSCELVRELKKNNIDVVVVMTKKAREFITPLTLEVLSQNKVIIDLFKREMPLHISLSDKADLLVVAPATYNFINKVACGVADDFLTTFVASFPKGKIIAPAMDEGMYTNPVLEGNIVKLKNLGYIFVDPQVGELASGKIGKGRLADISVILNTILNNLNNNNEDNKTSRSFLRGKNILITTGPTREYIDKIRYISNISSGRMGFYLAKACLAHGACVRLIRGNCYFKLKLINLDREINVSTTEEMFSAVKENITWADICIFASAVLDYKINNYTSSKLKETSITLSLTKNIDIIKEVSKYKDDKIFIGFSADDDDELIKEAKRKLKEKKLDYIIANSIKYFGEDINEAIVISNKDDNNIITFDRMSKERLASELINFIALDLALTWTGTQAAKGDRL